MSDNSSSVSPVSVFVSGVSGKLGSRILFLLKKVAPSNVHIVAGSRDASILDLGDTTKVFFDFGHKAKMIESLKNIDILMLVSGDMIEINHLQHKQAIDAAKMAGVKHIVYTSLVGAQNLSGVLFYGPTETEKYIQEAGFQGYTILRHNFYADLLDEFYFPNAIKCSRFNTINRDAKVAYVSRDDCAKSDVAAILNAVVSPSSKIISRVDGARGISVNEQAVALSSNKNCVFRVDEFNDALSLKIAFINSGIPHPFAAFYADIEASCASNLFDRADEENYFRKEVEVEDGLQFVMKNLEQEN